MVVFLFSFLFCKFFAQNTTVIWLLIAAAYFRLPTKEIQQYHIYFIRYFVVLQNGEVVRLGVEGVAAATLQCIAPMYIVYQFRMYDIKYSALVITAERKEISEFLVLNNAIITVRTDYTYVYDTQKIRIGKRSIHATWKISLADFVSLVSVFISSEVLNSIHFKQNIVPYAMDVVQKLYLLHYTFLYSSDILLNFFNSERMCVCRQWLCERCVSRTRMSQWHEYTKKRKKIETFS